MTCSKPQAYEAFMGGLRERDPQPLVSIFQRSS